MEKLQALIPNVESGEAASAEGITQCSVVKEEPAYVRQKAIYAQREKERERHKEVYLYYQECNSYNNEQPTFTKGYKVTLYSDSLRATTLYPIYTNGPNLGYQGGQCEYVHYTLVFDTFTSTSKSFDLSLLFSSMCILFRSFNINPYCNGSHSIKFKFVSLMFSRRFQRELFYTCFALKHKDTF